MEAWLADAAQSARRCRLPWSGRHESRLRHPDENAHLVARSAGEVDLIVSLFFA
jgi:hypothetical protein